MNFVKTIKINNVDYEVFEDCDGVNVSLLDEENMILGKCDSVNQKIYIHKDLLFNKKVKTLKHEITHAFIEEYGFSNYVFNEEDICNFVSIYGSEICRLTDECLGLVATKIYK